ncbi:MULTISPECIES: hypothetical protein, partial [unclassified Bradyrhizobium]|uniref:hypothetical protein n=1 Tax=unclassified Bradyrhizobium TaxID=2631580 RepID=UPI002916BEE8
MPNPDKMSNLDKKRADRLSPSPIWIVTYLAGYAALIVWFKLFDVYNAHFSEGGAIVALYSVFRIAFIFYLFWMVHAVGRLILRLFGCREDDSGDALGSLVICFFAGTGIWHLVMLGLGFLNLYKPAVVIVITAPIVCLGFFDLRASVVRFAADAKIPSAPSFGVEIGALDWPLTHPLRVFLVAAFAALLCVKGLYPAGGHDYFMHYFPYLRTVIERGGIWPNQVWYHFYYMKGAGLYFLGMLLTDPLAPQLVTFCFVAVASIALFRLLARLAPNSFWPSVGVILWASLYIYTPGVSVYRDNGGWGDFEKLHELNSALLIAILWLVSEALETRRLSYWIAVASATLSVIVLNITMAIYLGMIFSMLAAWLFWRGRRTECLECVGLVVLSGGVMLGIFLINFAVTGLVDDQGILQFWNFADVEQLYKLKVLPWVIMLYQARVGLEVNSLPIGWETLLFIFHSLRLDLLYPLVGVGLIVYAAAGFRLRRPRVGQNQLALLAVALIGYLVLALLVGRAQPISFYRYSSFVMPIMIALGVVLWTAPRWRWTGNVALRVEVLAPVLVLIGCCVAASNQYRPGAFKTVLENAWRFARGAYSIDQAYSTQTGWAGRLPWGAIYPGARGAYSVVGPHVPIWSMHMHSYCMLPGCDMRTHAAFTNVRDWDRLMFGTPEEARTVLQREGVNYFLFSRELAPDLKIIDVLPRAPLFAPDNIDRYFGIRWTDGKTALLTWAGSNTTPLDALWLADYRRAVAESPTAGSLPYELMNDIYRNLRATPHPWRSFKLP